MDVKWGETRPRCYTTNWEKWAVETWARPRRPSTSPAVFVFVFLFFRLIIQHPTHLDLKRIFFFSWKKKCKDNLTTRRTVTNVNTTTTRTSQSRRSKSFFSFRMKFSSFHSTVSFDSFTTPPLLLLDFFLLLLRSSLTFRLFLFVLIEKFGMWRFQSSTIKLLAVSSSLLFFFSRGAATKPSSLKF